MEWLMVAESFFLFSFAVVIIACTVMVFKKVIDESTFLVVLFVAMITVAIVVTICSGTYTEYKLLMK